MCGIIGYVGYRQAAQIIMEGLAKLEYRGYDSAGLAVCAENGVTLLKSEGRLTNLAEKLAAAPVKGCCGIGHTRWATHGAPSERNSHPHRAGRVTLIHNGIIENYMAIKRSLAAAGRTFVSETDTEVAAALIDSYYQSDPIAAIVAALHVIEGSYAFGILFDDRPGEIYAVRKDGPLLVAPGEGECFIASDMTAVIDYTRSYFTLLEGEIARLTPEDCAVFDLAGRRVEKELQHASWSVEQAQRGGYAHFMMKEIQEQSAAIRATLSPRIRAGMPDFSYDALPADFFSRFDNLHIVACGTAMHAGLIGKKLIEALARIPVQVSIASEFRYQHPIFTGRTLVVVISQSGETADSLAALRLAKSAGVTTLSLVNVAGSSIARETDHLLLTLAGPEISVASTKAYSVQLALLYLCAFAFARATGHADEAQTRKLTTLLYDSVNAVEVALGIGERTRAVASRLTGVSSVFYIGRGLDWALANEGSLKLKEISYIHSEAYAAGELKHGTISLITEGVPVVALATQEDTLPKVVSNIREVRARGAYVVLITKSGMELDADLADVFIELSPLPDLFMPLSTAAVLQLLAYYTAVERGCDVDKPRNLAKSVTVE